MAEKLTVLGARGASATEIARKTGSWGVLPTDTDAQALAKFANAAIQQNPNFKGDAGPTGPADNTFTNLAAFKASDIGRKTASLVGVPNVPDGRFNWTTGDFTGQADDYFVIKANSSALTVGAWVRQGAKLPNMIPDGRDNTAFFRTQVNSGTTTVPYGTNTFVAPLGTITLSGQVLVPAGRRIVFPAGSEVVWAGPDGTPDLPIDILYPQGAGVQIISETQVVFRAAADMHNVYCVGTDYRNGDDLVVQNVFGRRIKHVRIGTGAYTYANMVTPRMVAAGDTRAMNLASNIRLKGGGCRMDAPAGNFAACSIAYAFNWEVDGCNWWNAGHGLVWWGGGSSPNADGAVANQRKCYDGRVNNCLAQGHGVGGIWGSMGQAILVSASKVMDCLDVGFDAEGCNDTHFKGCYSRNNRGGCYTTFYLCNGISFENCTGIVTDRNFPLIKIYNEAVSALNDNVTVNGGTFENKDPSGLGLIAFTDPARSTKLFGATIIDATVSMIALNANQADMQGCTLRYTRRAPAAFNAISFGGFRAFAGTIRANATIKGNKVVFETPQPTGTRWCIGMNDDSQGYPTYNISGNEIVGQTDNGPAWARFANTAPAPYTCSYIISGNFLPSDTTTSSRIEVTNIGGGVAATFKAPIPNFDQAGTTIGLTEL